MPATQTNTQLPGLPSVGWTAAYGGVPGVTNPTSSAAGALAGNLQNLAGIYGLAGSVNTFQNQAAAQGLNQNLPGYGNMIAQSSDNILANLRGQVAPDVIAQIAQSAAQRGIAGGFGAGSPNSNAAYLRALGLTSMGLQQTGESQLTGAINRTPVAQPFNVTSMFVSPEQQQSAQQAANLYASAPNPQAAALAAEAAANRGIGAGIGAAGGGGGSPVNPLSTSWASDRLASNIVGGALGVTNNQPYDWYGSTFGNATFGPSSDSGTSYMGDPLQDLGYTLGWDIDPTNPGASEPPPGTVSTGTSSFLDPFADLTGGASYDFSMYGEG